MKKILAPIDGSLSSLNALKYTRDIAEKFGSEIILVNIQKPIFFESPKPETVDGEDSKTLEEKASMVVSQGMKILEGTPAKVRSLMKSEDIMGDPAEQILYLIDKEDVDIVIMGSHGYSGIRKFLMGSVSHKVVQHSPKPVMIIK